MAGSLLPWSYPSDRNQMVKFKNIISDSIDVLSGLGQVVFSTAVISLSSPESELERQLNSPAK